MVLVLVVEWCTGCDEKVVFVEVGVVIVNVEGNELFVVLTIVVEEVGFNVVIVLAFWLIEDEEVVKGGSTSVFVVFCWVQQLVIIGVVVVGVFVGVVFSVDVIVNCVVM